MEPTLYHACLLPQARAAALKQAHVPLPPKLFLKAISGVTEEVTNDFFLAPLEYILRYG